MERSQVQYGSQGSDVTELQKLLNKIGYSLKEDGIFGSKTQSAVTDFQKKNNLAVDGIAGKLTWSALGNIADKVLSSANEVVSSANEAKSFKYDDFKYDAYTESDAVKNAQAALNAQLAQKPGEYQSQWQSQLDDTINKILNREKFSYDVNGDALYQQYKDKYTQQAKMAMGDAIGQASAMTGGYGNSYAQSVGQQMYQKEMQNLNDIVPELYQMAYDKYNQEGQDLYNQYAMLGDRENQDYGRYRDSVSDWLTERDYLTGRYDTERGFDYSKYTDDRNFAYGQYADDKAYAYQDHRDAIADEQWQKEFEEAKRQFDEQMTFNREQSENSKSKANSSGGSSGSSSGGGSYSGGSSGGSNNNSSGNSTGNGSTNNGSSTDLSGVRQKASSYTTNEDLADYLDGLEASGVITGSQADTLYAEYKQADKQPLSNRSWTLVDDGGINWLWGIDNNAKVKDQYGNTYSLDKLVDALVAEGMSKSDAKAYVKKLQKSLGA